MQPSQRLEHAQARGFNFLHKGCRCCKAATRRSSQTPRTSRLAEQGREAGARKGSVLIVGINSARGRQFDPRRRRKFVLHEDARDVIGVSHAPDRLHPQGVVLKCEARSPLMPAGVAGKGLLTENRSGTCFLTSALLLEWISQRLGFSNLS